MVHTEDVHPEGRILDHFWESALDVLSFVWREENFEWDAGDGRPLGVALDVGDSDVTGLIGVRLEGFEGSVLAEAGECDFGHLVSSSPKCHLMSVSAL